MNDRLKYLFSTLTTNLLRRRPIMIVSEAANWVIKDICEELVTELNHHAPKSGGLTYAPWGLRNTLIHGGSVNTLVRDGKLRSVHPSNKLVLTWYHILQNDPCVAALPELAKRLEFLHTASTLTRDKLLGLGFPAEKLVLIPESVDRRIFFPITSPQKNELRGTLGLPQDKMIIGSFQKDGTGWGDGMEPKLIKGPDVFCDTVLRLAKKFSIHVLLTGPARGYVKERLTKANITFTHVHGFPTHEMGKYYQALDLYIVASREEGGPKAILESIASGVPLVTTDVGMARDVIRHGENGYLVPVEDREALARCSSNILADANLGQRIVSAGLETAQKYGLPMIVDRYIQEIYTRVNTDLFSRRGHV